MFRNRRRLDSLEQQIKWREAEIRELIKKNSADDIRFEALLRHLGLEIKYLPSTITFIGPRPKDGPE